MNLDALHDFPLPEGYTLFAHPEGKVMVWRKGMGLEIQDRSKVVGLIRNTVSTLSKELRAELQTHVSLTHALLLLTAIVDQETPDRDAEPHATVTMGMIGMAVGARVFDIQWCEVQGLSPSAMN